MRHGKCDLVETEVYVCSTDIMVDVLSGNYVLHISPMNM